MLTLIIGAFIAAVCFTVCFLLKHYLDHDKRIVLNAAYRKNCVEDACLTGYEEDVGRDLITATYEYQYRGEHYIYTKFFFGQMPTERCKLWWDSKHPDKAQEVENETGVEIRQLLQYSIIFVPAFLLSLFLPQLSIIFVGILLVAISGKHFIWGKVGIAIMAVAIFSSTVLWVDANIDPMAYDSVSYIIGSNYERDVLQLRGIENLADWEVVYLYEDIDWLNRDIREAKTGIKSPVFGQFVNKHLAAADILEWPAGYERFASYEYRRDILKEAGKW